MGRFVIRRPAAISGCGASGSGQEHRVGHPEISIAIDDVLDSGIAVGDRKDRSQLRRESAEKAERLRRGPFVRIRGESRSESQALGPNRPGDGAQAKLLAGGRQVVEEVVNLDQMHQIGRASCRERV